MVTVLLALGCSGADTDVASPRETGEAGDTDSGGDTAPTRPPFQNATRVVDRDGDGFEVGDDCDDDNPYVYPGADELCDALDQDCDGEPLAPGVCSKVGFLTAALVPLVRGSESQWTAYLRIVKDLTGDGHPDVLGGPAFESEEGDKLDVVWDGASLPDRAADFPEGAAAMIVDPTWFQDSYARFSPGDVDGDGAPDAAFFDSCCAGVYVFSGPLAQDHRIEFSEASYVWISGTASVYASPAVELDDIDGDGLADMGFGVEAKGDPEGESRFDIIFGSTTTAGEFATVREGDAWISLVPVGDVTGDGVLDAVYYGPHTGLIDLSLITRSADLDARDITEFAWDYPDEVSAGLDRDNIGVTSDWDVDGYAEVYIGQRNTEPGEGDGAIYFFQAPFAEVASYADATGTIAADAGMAGLGEVIWPMIESGSGRVAALGVYAGYDGLILVRDQLPVGVVALSEVDHVSYDRGPMQPAGLTAGHGEDLDDDGITDVGGQDADLGIFGYIPGFIPPWDDPTYW